MTTTTTQLNVTRTFAAPSHGKGRVLTATIRTTDGYFSVTGETGKPGARDCDSCGCIHDDILRFWPAIKPIVDLHLSDSETGEPMHAQANGWYWMAKAAGIKQTYGPDQSPEDCLAILCDHLRISHDEAAELRDRIKLSSAPREEFEFEVDSMRPRWAAEAAAGRKLIESL